MKKIYANCIILFSCLILTAQSYPSKFTNINGWRAQNDKQYFSTENLYDHINGASDFYLGYKFQDLWVVDYRNQEGQLVTVELYRHKSPLYAFGIYAEERPASASSCSIGAEGFIEEGTAFFLAGDYYVKVFNGSPAAPKQSILDFSHKVAERICEDCQLPKELANFPSRGKVKMSERYMAENFLGVTGFNGVFTSLYKTESGSCRLFIYKGSDADCKAFLGRYFDRLKYKKKVKVKRYDLEDPYMGKVLIDYKGGVITGILDSSSPALHAELLDSIQ
ncbi:MAG: hypothetical protein JEZ14_17755 [Marinilabiliaceae bacterium]|nr:hypothetical protein [Marinilabiliaceae bacterium]